MLVAKTPIYIANFPVDMRKSIDGLMLLAETHFSSNVTDGAYYVFGNKLKDKIKILHHEDFFNLTYKKVYEEKLSKEFKKAEPQLDDVYFIALKEDQENLINS